MNYIGTYVRKLKSGGFKVVVWGQPNYHMSDWRGCNYRVMTVKGQPHRGFKSIEDAEAFAKMTFPTEKQAKEYAQDNGDGSFLGDDMPDDVKDIHWEKNTEANPNVELIKNLQHSETVVMYGEGCSHLITNTKKVTNIK